MEHYLEFHGEGWTARCFISKPDLAEDIMTNANVHTLGQDAERALYGAKHVLDLLAAGRLAYIRVKPEVQNDRRFDTQENLHRGYVRFSFTLTPGEWHYPPENQPVVGLGPALEATQKNDAT